MSYVVVMPNKSEKKPEPPLSDAEVTAAIGLIREVASRLEDARKEGMDVDDRIRILCGVAKALNDGHKVNVEITIHTSDK